LYRHPNAKPDSTIYSLLRAFSIRNAPNLIIDTIKRGEDDEDVSVGAFPARKGKSIIIRVFDSLGGKATGNLLWGKIPVKKVLVTNLLEDDGEELEVQSFDPTCDGVEITVRTFEVLTLRLEL
jgi:alpha-mannosidase